VAGAALLGRLNWRIYAVASVVAETPRVRTIVFESTDWPGHLPGQHVDVRLTAEDGYQAQRSYSIASAPEEERLRLTVERLDDGEVSPYLVDDLVVGDSLELRGPIGGYFVWHTGLGGPLLLVAGGSGIVPLMAMLRHRAAVSGGVSARLLYSARSLDDVIYRDELEGLVARGDGLEVAFALTRAQPADWRGYRRRIDAEILSEVAWLPGDGPLAFVCGPTGFVESVARSLVDLGYEPGRVKTERFGPTGG
jgi:ferredoxin-NADP reductase